MTIHLATTSLPRGPLCGTGRDGDSTITASNDDPFHDRVDCAGCQAVLAVVQRAKCNMLDPEAPEFLPHACTDDDGHEEPCTWARDGVRRRANHLPMLIECAESAAATAQREAESLRKAEERMHAGVAEEPVEVSTPSGRLLGRWSA